MVRMLVLVRHGDPETFGPDGTDASRRLTEAGRAALRRAYPSTFALLGDADDVRLWVSPAVRALESAEVVAEALGQDAGVLEAEVHESLYAQDDEAFLAELAAEEDGCVIAVGHVPFMERMLLELTGCDLPFGKGCVAAVSFGDGRSSRGRLAWFVQGPRVS